MKEMHDTTQQAALLAVSENPLADKGDFRVTDSPGGYGVVRSDVVGSHHAVQVDALMLAVQIDILVALDM
jgi:hypothetical protein